MGIKKRQPLLGHLLQLGRRDFAFRVRWRHVADAQIVGHHHDDIGVLSCIGTDVSQRPNPHQDKRRQLQELEPTEG